MNKASKLLMSAFVFALSLMTAQSAARNASSATPQQASSERNQNTKINANIGGKILTATLADNPTARDFVSVLPLKLSMKDLFGRENRVVSAQATYPCGSSAVGGRVCEQRYAAERVLPESRFELQHTGSPSKETALEEKA